MSDTSPNPARLKLIALRIVWAALLIGQMMFLAVAIFVIRLGDSPAVVSPNVTNLILYIGCALLVGGLLGGHVIRGVITSRAGTPRGTTMTAYFTGTLVLLALLEAPALVGGVIIILARQSMPGAILAGLAILLTLVHFPLAANVDETL